MQGKNLITYLEIGKISILKKDGVLINLCVQFSAIIRRIKLSNEK